MHSSRHTESSSTRVNGDRKHNLGSVTSSSSTVPSVRANSVPNSPRHTPRPSYSLPPIDPSTDTEGLRSRPKHRDTRPSRRLAIQEGLVNEEAILDERPSRSRSRSRIDHSIRRILFVDSKATRRQTAPPSSTSMADPPIPVSSAQSTSMLVAESPVQFTAALPSESPELADRAQAQPQAPPLQSRPPSVNEFGEFVYVPPVGELDKGVLPGAESTSEKKTKSKEKRRSAFKFFSRKQNDSIGSPSNPNPNSELAPSTSTASAPPPAAPVVSASTSQLRRKSPYPAKLGSSTPNTRSVGVMARSMSISDAEGSSSCPTTSTSWLRSRPKMLTKKGRSNSLCSARRSTSAVPIDTPPPSSNKEGSSIFKGSLDIFLFKESPLSTPVMNSSLSPIVASPTSQSTSSAPAISRSGTAASSPSRPRFNPIRDIEMHLYNHGVGTGPGTRDAYEYCATPVPKEGIRRTNPYKLIGSPPLLHPESRAPAAAKASRDRREKTTVADEEDEKRNRRSASRRVSAPAGSISPSKTKSAGGPPATP